MPWIALSLLGVQIALLGLFSFFALFNALYGVASLRRPRILRTRHSGQTIAVVIVAFNEKHVLEQTIRACDALTYENRLIIVADDSTDPVVVESLRRVARARGCELRKDPRHVDRFEDEHGVSHEASIEIWESSGFVLFHRSRNVGFKGGSLRQVHSYLEQRGVRVMYLLDADWHPQPDALERTLEVLEADKRIAFVQTKRLARQEGLSAFQRYIALNEEGCYYVDFEGRQVLGHPILFSGCCTLLRLDAVRAVGGFASGHLTEDLDLSDKLWLNGWKGVYLGSVVNLGEVPFTYDDFRRQQERWAAGSARCLRDHFGAIVASKRLSAIEKLAALRQNAYFTTSILTLAALCVGVATVLWLRLCWDSWQVEWYLSTAHGLRWPFLALVYGCVLSNFIEPLVTIIAKKRDPLDLVHLPAAVWYGWSALHTYVLGNILGLTGRRLDWFRTPKVPRGSRLSDRRPPPFIQAANIATLALLISLYFLEGWSFGWRDPFALLWIPAFVLAAVR